MEAATLERQTALPDLGLPTAAAAQLRKLKVVKLQDIARLSEAELVLNDSVSETALRRIADMLAAVGLRFADPKSPLEERIHASRRLNSLEPDQLAKARAGLPDSADIGMLGLRTRTLSTMLARGCTTLGDVRRSSLHELRDNLERTGFHEVYTAVKASGQDFDPAPTQEALYQLKLIAEHELVKPTDPATPLQELAPFIGYAHAENIEAGGIKTMGELRTALEAGTLTDIKNVNVGAELRVRVFFGLAKPQPGRRRRYDEVTALTALPWPSVRLESEDA